MNNELLGMGALIVVGFGFLLAFLAAAIRETGKPDNLVDKMFIGFILTVILIFLVLGVFTLIGGIVTNKF